MLSYFREKQAYPHTTAFLWKKSDQFSKDLPAFGTYALEEQDLNFRI